MTTNSIPISELETSPAAKFTKIGDAYKGKITSLKEAQQTDINRLPLSWPDGSPRMQLLISIEQQNGDVVTFYAKGGNFVANEGEGESMRSAIVAAVREAKAGSLDVGAELAVAFTGYAKAEVGKSPAKLYRASYRAAAAGPSSIPVDLFND